MRSLFASVLFIISSAVVSPWVALAQSTSAVRPALAKPYLMAPIKIDDVTQTEAWVFPRAERRDFAIEAQSLLESLNSFLPAETLQRLKVKVTSEGTLSLRDLDSIGLTTQFSEADLELQIQIPLKVRKHYRLNFNFGRPDSASALKPTAQSGYLNFRVNKSFEYGPMPLAGRLDFVENINGFVLESGAEYLEQDITPWRRQDTRLRKDNEENMLRYTLGDLSVPARGFQLAPSIGGASVSREFSIQPYRTARPLGNQEIQIKRPSLVELYINGSLYSQIRLMPGNFNIRDFPLAAGQNNVKIKVRDDLGQEEVFDFSMLFENTILTSGIHEFSYNVGLPWRISGGDRAYDQHNNIVSFFHRYGFNDQFTGGLNVQNYSNQNLGGLEISKINTWGYTSADVAISDNQQIRGAAGRLRYRSLDRMFGQEVRSLLTVEFEKRDSGFQPVSVVPQGTPFLDSRYDLQLTHRFERGIMAGIGGGYQKAYVAEDLRLYRANLILPFSSWSRLEFSYNKNVGYQAGDQGFVSFYWTEREGLLSASAYYDTNNKSTNLSFARANRRNYDDYRLWGTVQNLDKTTSANISGEYLTQAGNLRLDQFSRTNDGSSNSMTTLGVSTALAWVGTDWALSQPINDSFTLISVPNMPKENELIINPDGNQGEGKVGRRQVATLPNQTSYYVYQVNLDSSSLPLGYLLEQEYFNVKPTYRSGILIAAPLIQKVMVKGRMLDSQGQALAFLAGDIYNSANKLVDNTFFTNKDGKFFIEGLEAGTYKIVTDQIGLKEFTFVVPSPKDAAVLNLGDVVISRGQE